MPNFSRGLKLSETVTVIDVKSQCDSFAILKLDQKRTGLYLDNTVFRGLRNYNISEEFLRCCFTEYQEGHYYVSKPDYNVFSVKKGPYAETKEEVLNFCSAYKDFLNNFKNAIINDIVYVEEFDILLPIAGKGNDGLTPEGVLGAWLTEGLPVDASNYEKVCLLNQWLSPESIEQAIVASGLEVKRNKQQEKAKEEKPKKQKEDFQNIGKFELPGREELSQYFNDQIVDFIRNMDKYENMGIHSIPATLLYGKPGCGKTYAVERLAEFLDLPCFEINSGSVASPYVHDTSKKVSEIFTKAIDAAPSVLIIDEMEAYLSSRDTFGGGAHHIEEVDEFLRNIPKALDAKVIIFGMTNMIDLLDPAILRKGRFDSVIEVGMPSKQEVLSVLRNGMKGIPVEDNIDYELIAEALLERPMSDVGYVIRQAARSAVKNNSDKVKKEHFLEAVNSLGKIEKEPERRRIGFNQD